MDDRWIKYRDYVRRLAMKYRLDPDDAEQSLWLGFGRLLDNYDSSLGTFESYAYWHVRWALSKLLCKEEVYQRYDPDRWLRVVECRRFRHKISYHDKNWSRLELPPILGPREQEVLRLKYVSGFNGSEIGELLGVTRARISQIEIGALAKLRRIGYGQ